ncbi:hypothetical protein L6452_05536 [Arctium lappa]|uniref:Uncharacterized protein n=1 Tax=Arctium lappa TaxID=4217 RepID=A0ACB9EGZ3_ARCLA|nr:hypothetical protein L6452_05536 [Arctium lappa]
MMNRNRQATVALQNTFGSIIGIFDFDTCGSSVCDWLSPYPARQLYWAGLGALRWIHHHAIGFNSARQLSIRSNLLYYDFLLLHLQSVCCTRHTIYRHSSTIRLTRNHGQCG